MAKTKDDGVLFFYTSNVVSSIKMETIDTGKPKMILIKFNDDGFHYELDGLPVPPNSDHMVTDFFRQL